MPITMTIDRKRGVIFTTAGPVLTDQEWMRHHKILCEHPYFDADLDQLLDFRQVADCRLTPEVMRITAVQPVFGPDSRQAFVAHNNLTYGMCRMFEILSAYHGFQIEVFRDYLAAEKWLGRDRLAPSEPVSCQPARIGTTGMLSLYQMF